MLAAYLEKELKTAGIPILGVSIVESGNRVTWTVEFQPSATDPQKAQAQAIIDALTWDAATSQAEVERSQFDGQKLVKAVAIYFAQQLSIPLATARQAILTIYRGL